MTLRLRLALAFGPLALLLAVLGVVGSVMLHRTGDRIDAIMRENYASVQAMFRLNEAAERIDSSFQFALAGRKEDATKQYAANWVAFEKQFESEAGNITIHPDEDELVGRLAKLKAEYRTRGDHFFFERPDGAAERTADYFGEPGLLGTFQQIKETANEILRVNHANMEAARDDARATARTALIGFGISLAVVALLLALSAGYLIRTILSPIRAVTEAARAVGLSGHLDRQVPVFGRDELGQLAEAFNAMTRQLRVFRQSNLAKLLRAQRTAQATIDSFPDPVLVVDPTGRVDLANPAAGQILGVQPSAGGRSDMPWQPPDSLRAVVRDAFQRRRAYSAESFDDAVTFRSAGEDRAYFPQVRPIRDGDGETLGAAVVLHDVTRFRVLDQFKTDLVANVSHELKTPLTSVRLALHVLLEERVGPLTPKQTELLVDARDNSERLLGLIDQLLALARLQRPQAESDRIAESPAELLGRAADTARQRAQDKHVEMSVDSPTDLPPVRVDGPRMATALDNLVSNAIAYTPAGGRVTLTAARTPDGRVELAVADSGVGIPPDNLPHVFERFFRVPGQSSPSSTGLGLAIVKEVVVAHGGTVTCESAVGRGTTFRITLPAAGDRP
jgi:PAS domain S-box-containing protein